MTYKTERTLLPDGYIFSHGDGIRIVGYTRQKNRIYQHVDSIIDIRNKRYPHFNRAATQEEIKDYCK